jgi:hypothetical protein
MASQRGEEREAIHLGHHDVGEHEIGTAAHGQFESDCAVCRGEDLEAIAQEAAYVIAHVAVVFGEENHGPVFGLCRTIELIG